MRMDTVPAGMSEWPLITAGVAPGQVVEGTAAAAAVTAFFSTATLRPKRLTGRFEFTNEVNAQVLDLEAALRRDLADAVKSAMSDAILNGAAVDPQDGGDGGDDDPTKMLKSDLAVGKGRTMVVETTSARWGDG